MARRASWVFVPAAILTALGGCHSVQSTFEAHGPAAERIAHLSSFMTVLFLVITVIMWGLFAFAFYRRRGDLTEHAPIDTSGGEMWIAVGGVAIPLIVLTVLFVWGLAGLLENLMIVLQRVTGFRLLVAVGTVCAALPLSAQMKPDCSGLPNAGRLRSVVQAVVKQGASKNGGMGNQEWAAVVNRDGVVCAIVFSGTTRGDQWPGSRVIAGEKANTANALSGRDYALSTANVYAAAQPGQSLYSLATAAPPNSLAVFGNPATFGTPTDPMVGKAIGGIIVFAGGLPLYANDGMIVGGLGLSGDTSCTDHVIAWKVRHELHLDAVPMGPSPDHNDNMILDFNNGVSQSGFGHPSCKGGTQANSIIQDLSKNYPTGPRSE